MNGKQYGRSRRKRARVSYFTLRDTTEGDWSADHGALRNPRFLRTFVGDWREHPCGCEDFKRVGDDLVRLSNFTSDRDDGARDVKIAIEKALNAYAVAG